jgi:NADH-quinone oxidoreductase subunit C
MSDEKKLEGQPEASPVKDETKENGLKADGVEEGKEVAPDESSGAIPAAVAKATGEAVESVATEPPAEAGGAEEAQAQQEPTGANAAPAQEAAPASPVPESGEAASASTPSEVAEAAAEVGKLTPGARASETALSADAQAAVERAAAKQAASPAAQTTSEPSDAPAAELQGPSDEEKDAKAKAAAEARAARANARAGKATEEGENAAPKEPSPNQPILDRLVEILKESVGDDVVEQAFINEKDSHLPYVIIKKEHWPKAAQVLKSHEELQCDFLRNVSGIDQETHMEVAYHLFSFKTRRDYCIKVKTDRESPSIASVTPQWATANWNEREVFDLLGIDFPGHPDLRRIMMSDEWVGHPLRKDYEPLDPEV